jgi:hypothetical protein
VEWEIEVLSADDEMETVIQPQPNVQVWGWALRPEHYAKIQRAPLLQPLPSPPLFWESARPVNRTATRKKTAKMVTIRVHTATETAAMNHPLYELYAANSNRRIVASLKGRDDSEEQKPNQTQNWRQNWRQKKQ